MRQLVLIGAICALGWAQPAIADETRAQFNRLVATAVMPSDIDGGWTRRAISAADIEVFFPRQTREATSADGTEIVATARRGSRSQSVHDNADAAPHPFKRIFATWVGHSDKMKTTMRRGKRHNSTGTEAAPIAVYTRGAAAIAILARPGPADARMLEDGIEIASGGSLAEELAGGSFLTAAGTTYQEYANAPAPDVRILVGPVGDDAHLVVLARAEPAELSTVLGALDLSTLRAWSPAAETTPEPKAKRRGRQ